MPSNSHNDAEHGQNHRLRNQCPPSFGHDDSFRASSACPVAPMSLPRPTPAFLVALATAFSLLGDQALYSVLPVMHADLGLSALQVGLLLSVNRWIRLLTNEFAHRLAARRAPTYLLPAALLLGAITTALYAMSSAFTVLLLARMLWGLAWSFIRPFIRKSGGRCCHA